MTKDGGARLITQVWGGVAVLGVLVAAGAALGALLIPSAFFWLVFGG